MTLPEGYEKGGDGDEGSKGTNANSRGNGLKLGIGIAVAIAVLYAAAFAVAATKSQNSPAPENTQNMEENTASQSSQENTTPENMQENTNMNQPSFNPQLSVDISFAKNPISSGSVQTITVTVFDGGYKSYLASVEGTVTYASDGTQKHFGGTTDGYGQVVYSWEIEGNSTPGMFSVDVNVSAGNQSISKHSSFEVIPTS